MISETLSIAISKERFQNSHHVPGGGGMYLYAYDTGMRTQRQDGPIAKMSIQGDQDAVFRDGMCKNFSIIGSAYSD